MTGPWTPPPVGGHPPPPPVRVGGPVAVFQALLWLWFGLAATWASIGRFFLGSGGWYGIIMLFTVLPLGLLYGVVISIVVYLRCTKLGQLIQRWTTVSLVASLVGLVVAGFTIVDGGDSPDSLGSLLTNALHADPEGPIGQASMLIAYAALIIAAIGMLAGLVLAFVEKPGSPAATSQP